MTTTPSSRAAPARRRSLDRWGANIVVLPAGAEALPGAWTTGLQRRGRRRPDPLDALDERRPLRWVLLSHAVLTRSVVGR